MPAHFTLKVSDSHNTLKSGIVPGGFSALSLKMDPTRHSFHHNTQHPHSRATAATLHHHQIIKTESDTRRFLSSMPAIQQYKIHPQRDIIHEVTGLNGVRCWWSQSWMADSSTTTPQILSLIVGDCWAWCQLHNGIRYVPVASKLMKSLSSVQSVSGIKMAIFYSMADISTTGGRILIPFAGGCWAWGQLSNGIGYVSVASKPRKLLSSVEGIFIVALAIFYSMVYYSTTSRRILLPFAGSSFAQCQLPNCIRYVPVASKLRNSLSSVKGVLGIKLVIFYSTADISTTAGRILILFARGCWAWCQLPNCIKYVSVASKPMNSLSSVEGILVIKLVILYSTADISTTTPWILILFAGGCWAWCQLSKGIRYVSVASKPMNLLSSVGGVSGIKLAIFYSTAHYSTTGGQILMLFAGGFWPWHRLHNDIRHIPRDLCHEVTVLNGVLAILVLDS